MLELASLGAKVLQTRSVELAMQYKVKVRVLNSFKGFRSLLCDEGGYDGKEGSVRNYQKMKLN